MAIKCSITEGEFDFVYGMTKSFIQNKIDNNQVFDISSYMDYLYERIKRATSKLPDSKTRTAQILAEAPKIIEAVYFRNFNQPNLDKFFIDFEKIGLLKRKFSQKDIELANVTEYFEKANKVDVRNNKRSLENTKGATKLTLNPTFDKNASPRLVSRTVLSGTLPAFRSVKRGELRIEEPDIERIIINRNFESIITKLNIVGSALNQFEYNGVPVRLTAVNLSDFTLPRNPETAANFKKLDSTTQQEILTSRTLMQRGIQRSDVTQVNKRAIMLMTDLDGNPLSFDNEGNILDPSDENGKYVFQFMRDIKKLEDGSFQVRDIFGSEDRIATPTTIADERRAIDKSKTPTQHLEDVIAELELYKKVRDKALTEPVALDLVGMTPGLSASLKTKDIKLSDLREKKVATSSNISKIITLDKKFQNFGRGSTIIKIQGEYYLVDRNRMPNEIASQIKDVLFKEDINLEVKKDFYSQFIPENKETILDYKMRRHKIIPFDNHLVLQLFTQRGSDKFKAGWPTQNGVTKALKHEILIDNTGVYLKDKEVTDPNDYLSGYTKQDQRQIEALKKEFNEVLAQAYTEQDPTPGATFMSYPRHLIASPTLFQTYLGNGKFKKGNYIDFILSQPTIVKIQPTQNDMYNRQIIFKEPTITSKEIERSVENLEVTEIFNATPELSEIGTEQDYVKYIQSIFPKSQVKDILYHGTYQEFDEFSKEFLGENTGLGNYTDPETGEVIQIDSANALFFSDNKINALTYSYIGREQFLNRLSNSIDRILDGVTGEKFKEYVDFLKTVPYFNNLIEETKAKAKSQNLSLKDTNELVKDQLRNERKRLRKARSKLDAKAAGNQINNLTTSINRLKTYKNSIERFQKNDPTITVENYQLKDLDFTGYDFRTFNETNEIIITFNDGRFQFKSKKDNGSFGLDFYADEVDAKTINNFLNSAIEGVESELEKYSETRKSLGYVDRVIPVVLNLENPNISDYEASYFTDKYKGQEGTSTQLVAAKQVKAALESGNDGVVYENVIDPYISTNYGVFNTDQIHILGNAKDIDGFKKFMGVDAPTSNLQSTKEERERFLKAEKARLEQELSELDEGTTKVDKIMFKADKGSIEAQLKTINSELNTSPLAIPAELQDLIVPTTVFGKQQTIFESLGIDRYIVAVIVDGKRFMFYKSMKGTSGKVAGQWYPFYGRTAPWIVKDGFKSGTTEWQYNSQASPELQAKLEKAADRLNKVYGDTTSFYDLSIPTIDTTETEINTIIGSPVKEGALFEDRDSNPETVKRLNVIKKQIAEEGFIPFTSNPQTSGGIEVIKPEQDITPKENKKQVDEDNDLDTEEGGYGDLFDELERSGDLEVDEVTKADIERAEDFWKNSETGKLLSKHVSLQKVANLVNSDAYAKFVVSGATLANPDILGTIKINKAKGSMVDIYHEGFHAFTQLFLSPAEKKALYNEVLNFTDANGNKPYENMDARQIEEMLAEDFRTYMKKASVKKGSPKRNSIFRRILNFLKALFGKLKSVKVKDVKLDIMSVPAVNELFTNLKSGNKDFLNKYEAKISNAKFLELDRGITALEKTGRETRKRSILNKQDSDLVSESIDSAISVVIDRIYKAKVKEKKAANQQISPNFKAISLAALLDPKYRSKVYGDVKLQFQERVQELNTEFQNSIGGNTLTDIINSEDPLDTLKDSIAGKLIAATYEEGPKKGKKKTTDKYVLLESQIDSFDNLIPNTKKGQRTAGSSYWGIKIVGNYYTVPGLQDADGRPIEIIVVSDPEDVAVQYDNYIEGGSSAYDSFMTFNDRAPVLNDDQAVIFNQIRILTTALNNWGTLGDLSKNVAPTGTIAYHIRHSDFEIGKAKYYVADEVDPALVNNEDVADTEDPIDIDSETEIDEGSTESLGMNPDLLDGKRSLLQLADKEVVYLLKSLHEIKSIDKKGKVTYAKNRLGFRQRANFMKTWNIISKTIGGVQDRQVAYDLLQKEAEAYPVLQQLLDTKLPSPKGLTNSIAFSLNAAFWHTFAKPSAIYKQFTIKEKTDKSGFDFYVEDSSPAINSILLKFTADFKSATSPYVNLTTEEQAAMLDSEGLIKKTGRDGVKVGMERTFLKALGINIDVTDKLNSLLVSDESEPSLRELATFVTKIADLKANKEKTTAQLNVILKFESDPVDFFKNKDRYIDELKEAGLYKKANEIRVDTAVKYFAGIQAKYGFDSPGEMIKLPDGNMASTVTNHMTLTSLIDGINSLDTLEDAWTLHTKSGYLGHLDPTKNFFINRSKTIDSLFAEEDAEGSRKRIEGSNLDFIAFAGSEIVMDEGSSGKTTSDLTSIDKFYQNLHYMLLGGIVEGSRAAEKNSAFGISPAEKTKIILDNGTRSGDNTRLWIDTDKFIPNEFYGSVGEDIAIKGFMLDYIATEFDRIKFFKENPEILKTTKGFNNVKSNDVMAGLEFSYMEDMLSDTTKNKLYKLAEPGNEELTGDIKEHILNDADLLKAVTEDLIKYFDQQINDLYDNYLLRTPFELNKTLFGDDMTMSEEEFSSRARGVLSSYYYNSWISRFEQNNLVMGDMAQLDHAKEAATKRLPGPQSNGTGFLIDEDAQTFVNEVWNKLTYAAKFEEEGIDTLTTDGSINVGIVNDPERVTLYLKEQEDSWREGYEAAGLSEDVIKARLKEDNKKYKKIEEADGHAVITLDAYRMMKKLGGPKEWTEEQESLYQDIINGKQIDPNKAARFFPVYKLQFHGPIMNAKINTTMMLKFAVTPISPSWAKPGTEAYKLHKKMMKENMPMISFGTGSKMGALSFTEGKAFDNLFVESKSGEYRTVNEDAEIAPNKLHLKYFKDVTKVSSKLKKENTLGTQDRVITLDTLYDKGELVEGIDPKLVAEYKKATQDISKIYKAELLERIGYEYVNGKYKGNIKRLVSVLRNELELKEIPSQILDMLDVRLNDQLSYDFSVIPVADVIEKTLVNLISKSLVKQKTNGEALVNVPVTLFGGVWEPTWPSEEIKQEALAGNEALIKKYLGTNGLPSYRRGEVIDKKTGKRKPTYLAKAAIAFNGQWLNLLNLKFNGKQIGINNVDGTLNMDASLENLNRLIKTDDFLKEHGDKIRIAGPRIPTDAINLKEAFEVWHFLPADAGSQVIIPTEIVAKAGSDFDLDKIFFSYPNIESNGQLTKPVPNFKEQIERLKSENKSTRGLILQQKRFAQNEWLRTNINIIREPNNYGFLTKPTSDYLVRGHIEKYYLDREGSYNPKKRNIHIQDERITGTRVGEEQNDLEKHRELLGGNRPLGISAKKDKQHALYKSIGAKFPKTYILNNKSGKIERKFVLNFNHEKTKDGNISLSSSTNVDNISISDIFSHGLQGILDRANDSFISKANIVKETLPVLNRLIESGVSFPIALDFINQPLIVEFIEGKIQSGGFISGELSPIYDSDILRSMASKLDEGGLDILENAIRYSNEKRMNEVLVNLENSKFQGKILIEYMGARKKYNSLQDFKQKFNTDPSKITSLTIKAKGDKIYSEVFRKDYLNRDEPSLKTLKESSYYISEYLWNNYFDGKDATLTELRKNIDDSDNNSIKDKNKHTGQQLAALAHYFQIADQSSGMEQIEIFFNPDTKLVDTLVSVQNRESFINALELDSKIDADTLKNLLKTSIISSLYESDIFLQLVPGLMPLRTMPRIINYISKTLSSNRSEIEKRFGTRAQDKDRYISSFNNAIVDYIYQNVMSNYVGDNALPTQLPSLIKKQSGDYSVKSFTGTLAEPIKINDNQINVDLTKLKKIYKGGFFLSSTKGTYAFATLKQDSFSKKQNPFKTFDSFVRYAIEKQILYKTYSEDDYASKLKYESFISERALRNTNNRAYIMGTTKYSFTKKVLATIKKYPHLSYKYPVLLQLSESFQGKRVQEGGSTGLSLLELKDKKIITPEQAAEYAKNLQDLGDISVQKSNNADRDKALKANKEISEVFANFSLMMYYQQGVGKSSLSFNKALNGVAFTEIMTNAVNSFMTLASDKNAQAGIDEVLNGIRSSILEGKGYKNYLKNASTFLKIEDADLSDTEDTETISELDKLKAQLEVAKLEQDADSVKSLSEAIRDLESRLAAEKAQGEFPVAPGVEVVSKEYGVTKVNTNPNASTTTSLIALMQPQILAQLYKENKGAFANAMFNYGYRWTRTENAYAPLDITSASTKAGEKEYYAYDTLDQNQNPLPSINTLDPIIKIVEDNLGMDMSGYDSAIVNIYEGKEHIYPHKDTSEDVTAEGYPVVVYSMGNDSSLGIWDDNKGKMTFAHKYREPGYGPYKGMKPTNEVLTQNGSIYTFGMNGNGRFALTHTTPTNANRTQDFPPITMPDGRVVTKYTVTVTFRRAAPLESGMPVKPGRKVLSSETPLTPGDAIATYRQDLVSGIQAYGTVQKANKTAVDLLGPNPTSIDMIDAGIRTRTTRSAAKAGDIRIGDVILHRGKSADGTEKMIYAKITNIHPKGSEGYKGTWSKEGWTAEGVDNIDRFGDGAMAIEFEVIGNYMSKSDAQLIKDRTETSKQKEEVLTADELTNHSGGAYGADTFFDSIGRDFNVLNHNHYKSPNDAKVSATLKNAGVEAKVLTDKQMDEAYRALDKLTGKTNSRNKINDLLARNYFQVKNADAVYAIAPLNEKGTDVKGGTSYAVNYAKRMKKPIYVWDINTESWFKWAGKSFVSTETPKLTRNFAGIGSRDLQNYNVLKDGKWVPRSSYVGDAKSTAAKKAITELYENTLTSSPVPVNSVEVGRFVQYKGNVYIALKETNQGWQIYNPKFEGPNSKLNVKLENLKPMKEKADLVLDDKTNRLYLITPDKNIISLTSGKLMKWAKNNGDRIRILSLIDKKESEKPPVELNAGQTFTGLTFNQGQADAIKKMKEFLNSDEQEFVLEGKAGTGKTTVMKEVLLAYQNSKENRKKNILVGALSWQATNVLDSTLKGKPRLKYTKNSLAGMLDQKMDEITHKMTKATYSTEGAKVGWANLIIIDEASMVNEQHLEILRDQALAKGEDIKIIYLGDRGQLPPIREFKSNKNSPVFEIENRTELTERVRQGEESPILPYADLYWNNADNENPVADPANGNRSSVTQQDGQLLFTDGNSAIEIAIQEYKKAIELENYDLIKYVTYTNARRFRVNKEIHKEIFGKDAHFYTPTTPVRFNAPYTAIENIEEISFINSDQAVVDKIIEQGEDEYGIAFVKLEILTPLSLKPVTITTVDYTKEALKDKMADNAYNMRLNKLNARYYRIKNDPKSTRVQEKAALNEYLEYKRRYAPISQDYAVTSHKSQGSTYNTVIVDELDIYNVKALTPKVRSNSMYTGITRAKNNVLIISNRTTPYQGKITLLEDTAVQINQSTGVDTKLAKFYESLTPGQIEKLGVDSAQALQEKYDNLAFADTENSYTIEDFILDQTEKCKL